MPASEPSPSPLLARPRWLLIGNSRWHWAEAADTDTGLRFWHDTPAAGAAAARRQAPWAWAAVGAVGPDAGLDAVGRLAGGDVPLRDAPPWLGIDRALAGWLAWREEPGRSVLVVDAGTVLSLTRVDGEGRFRGGRLLAGAALQLRAMAAGTAALPDLSAARGGAVAADHAELLDPWPAATAAAMLAGVAHGLVAAIAAAARDVQRAEGECRLLLTGGDGPLLRTSLEREIAAPMTLNWRPGLCLEALAQLRPAGRAGEGPSH